MKLKEQQEQSGGAVAMSPSSSSSKSQDAAAAAAKRKPGRQLSEDVARGGWDQQAAAVEMMQLDPLGEVD